MNTTENENMKNKKIEIVEIETFAIADHHQIDFSFFFFASHE